jgi:hypothetical protein
MPKPHQTVLVLRTGNAYVQEFGYDGVGCGGTHSDNPKECDCGDWWWCEPYGDGTVDEDCYDLDGEGESTVTHWQAIELPAAPPAEPHKCIAEMQLPGQGFLQCPICGATTGVVPAEPQEER